MGFALSTTHSSMQKQNHQNTNPPCPKIPYPMAISKKKNPKTAAETVRLTSLTECAIAAPATNQITIMALANTFSPSNMLWHWLSLQWQ